MEDAYLVGTSNGKKTWSVKAKRVDIAQNRSTTTVTGMSDGKIFDDGKLALKLQAKKAVYDIYGKNLQLSGGIKVDGLNGQTIRSNGAFWNSGSSTLRSIGQVEFQDKWNKIHTKDLLVDVKSKEVSMWNVQIMVDIKDVEKLTDREDVDAE